MSNANDFVIEKDTLKKYVGPGGDVVIPEGVTKISGSAFKGCANLTSVVIPEGVTRIAESLFDSCTNLTSVVIPEGVTNIGYYAFQSCTNLTSIVIPESATSIGNCAFSGCTNLTSIAIPESVTYVGKDAFRGCKKLKRVKLPVSLGAYLKNFLEDSDGLQIHIADLSALPAKYRPCAALCFAEDGGQPEDPRFESHSKYLIANAGKLVDLAAKAPALLALLCREKWIKAKDADAFLAAAQQTENAETIAMMLDYQSTKLTSQEKGKEQQRKEKEENTVFDRAVARMNQEGITGLNFVVDGMIFTFEDKNELKEYIVKKGGKLQTSISAKTDYLITNNLKCNVEKIRKATELGIAVITERQFNDKAGRSFVVKRGVLTKYLGAGGDVVIPKDVTSVDSWAFGGCEDLTGIVIPEGVTSIGDGAFNGCKNLTSITIPESVTIIGDSAFSGCEKLSDADGFVNVRGKLFHYTGAGGNVIIPEGVTNINCNVFRSLASLTGIVIPAGVTSIDSHAFSDCPNLTSVIISKSVTSIGDFAFNNCPNLTNVVIPESVIKIGKHAFCGCKKMCDVDGFVIAQGTLFDYSGSGGSVVVPAGVTSIDSRAFSDCLNLTSVVIPEGVTIIDGSAFSGCANLTSIIIPESVTSIGNSAFKGCANLTDIVIPKGVTSIGDWAFSGCINLTSITIPEGVTSIGCRTFDKCTSLTNIVIPESVTSINDWAFCFYNNMTIHAPVGSYAETYAKEHNIPFVAE